MEAARRHPGSANPDLDFTNARINGHITTAQSAAREERGRLEGESGVRHGPPERVARTRRRWTDASEVP